MRKIIIFYFLTLNFYLHAQINISWQKCLGGSDNEIGQSVIITSDGDFVTCGWTYSNDGDVSGNHGSQDVWISKISSTGILQWQKCFGGTGNEAGLSIQQTTDGGFIFTATSDFNNGNVSGNHGGQDAWVVKLSALGIIEWQKCIGGSNYDLLKFVEQTSDGGFILTGRTSSNDGDVSGNHGADDAWVVKLSNLGVIEWQKCLGGSSYDFGNSIKQTSDGGYIIAGLTNSTDGEVTGFQGGISDVWVIKLSILGILEWQKCIGGSDIEQVHDIEQTPNFGYIVTGSTASNDGDISGNHGSNDVLVVGLSNLGIVEWQYCYGGSGNEIGFSIQHTYDYGYVIAGRTSSFNGNVSGNNGNNDIWIIKINSNGQLIGQKCLGGSDEDQAYSIKQTTNGYIVMGSTTSNNGDVSGNNGNYDTWLVKLDGVLGIEEFSNNTNISVYPNPIQNTINLKINDKLINETYTIIDISGKILLKAKLNEKETSVNLDQLSKGIYFIKVADLESIKFIKE